MATINRSNIGDLHDQISVKLSKEDYLSKFEKALKTYSKNANIPGFRKGQVPTGMIKKMYGHSLFVDEVLRQAYAEVENYLRENNPAIFGQPLPLPMDENQKIDFNNPSDYTFNFEIGLKPEFSIPTIDAKKSVTKYEIDITDEMLEKELEALRKRAGKLEDIESQKNDEDLIYITYSVNDNADIQPIEDVVEYGRVPQELKNKITGTKVDDTFTFGANELSDEAQKESFVRNTLKGNKDLIDTTFDAKVTKVATLIPREMNEEFYAEVFPGSEIKEEGPFKEELKKAIAEQLNRFTSERLQNDIFETLIHETEVNLPEGFLKRWIQTSNEKPKTEEEVEKEWPTFSHQLKWTLISDQLLQKYEINVTYDEVMEDIRQRVLAYFGGVSAEDAPWMDSYLEKMAKDENTMNETHRRLLMDKLFKAVETDLDIVTQKVSDEEFSKIPALYAHQH